MGSGKSAVGREGMAGRGCADRAEKVLVKGLESAEGCAGWGTERERGGNKGRSGCTVTEARSEGG